MTHSAIPTNTEYEQEDNIERSILTDEIGIITRIRQILKSWCLLQLATVSESVQPLS